MLGTREKDGSLAAVQLTVDLKPNLPGIVLAYFVQHSGIRLSNILNQAKQYSCTLFVVYSCVSMLLLCVNICTCWKL